MTTLARYLALAAAAVAMAGMGPALEAKPVGSHHGHIGHGHYGRPYLRYYGPVVPVYPLVTSCEYYRSMWRRTGRYYWKVKYYDCMDW